MWRLSALWTLAAILASLPTNDCIARGRIGGGRAGAVRSVPRGGFSGRGLPTRSSSRGSIQSRMPTQSRPTRSPSMTMPRTSSRQIGPGSSRPSVGGRIGSGGVGSNRSGVTIRPGIGSGGPQTGSRPQIGSGRVSTGQFPGLSSRPSTPLPGLGSGNAAQQLQQRFPDLNRDTLRQP